MWFPNEFIGIRTTQCNQCSLIPKRMTLVSQFFLVNQTKTTYNYSFVLKKHWTWESNTWKEECRTSPSTQTDDANHVCVPWVPLDLLFVGEFEEARADSGRCPGAHTVKEPLESAKTHHRDEQDQLAEGVHGHPTPLQEKEQKKTLKDSLQ